MIQEARKNAKENTTEKVLTLKVPYKDNEDYILSPLGLGTPVNFMPLQIETLKKEKLDLYQKINELQKRIQDMEMTIGQDPGAFKN